MDRVIEILDTSMLIMASTIVLGIIFALFLRWWLRKKGKPHIEESNRVEIPEEQEKTNPYKEYAKEVEKQKPIIYLNRDYFDMIHPIDKIDIEHIMEQMELKSYMFPNQMKDISVLMDDSRKANQRGVNYLYDLITEELLDNGKSVVCLGSTKHAYLRNINTVKELLAELRDDWFLARSELHNCIHGVERVIVVARNPLVCYDEFDDDDLYDDDDE